MTSVKLYGADHIVDANEMISTKHVKMYISAALTGRRFDTAHLHKHIAR